MNKYIEKIRIIIIYFICFSFIGWIYEVALFLIDDHIFVNRGVLYGPWLPVYGCGGIVIYYLFYHLKNKPVNIKKINIRPILIYTYITVTSTVVELLTTYICDFLKSDWTKLWNYSKVSLNFEGRVALVPSLKFGVIGILGVYIIVPIINKFISINKKSTKLITNIIIILFIIDVIIHLFIGSTYVGPA